MATFGNGFTGNPGDLAASGYHVSSDTADRATQSPGGLRGFLGHGDLYSGFKSSNVSAAQYDPHEDYLQIGYKNGGWYGYHGVSSDEAASFYRSGSKGNWVWDHLRRRGTVFGYQKAYSFIGGRSQEYQPKYYASDKHREEHRQIGRAGQVPSSWLGGEGPYDAEWLKSKAPHPRDDQYPMTGATPHSKAPRPDEAQSDADYIGRKYAKAYHAPPIAKAAEEIPVATHAPPEAKPAAKGKGFWGWLGNAARGLVGSIFGRGGQHKAAGGEVEQRLGDGGDNEPILATPGEYVETREERAEIDRKLGRDSSRKADNHTGRYAAGGEVQTLLGGFLGNALGGSSGGAMGASIGAFRSAREEHDKAKAELAAQQSFIGPIQPGSKQDKELGKASKAVDAASAATGIPAVGMVVAGAQLINDQFDKLSGGLGKANETVVGFATGFATTLGVPKSLADLGGSVLGLVSPLKGLEVGVKAAQFVMMPILNLDKPGEIVKDVFKGIADVGSKVVTVLLDLRDPANMLRQSIGPFVGQINKFNPGAVDRMNLAFDNLSAAAGRIFEPIIGPVTAFADELNVLYTSVQSELRPVFGETATLIRDSLRQPIVMLVGLARDGAPYVQSFLGVIRSGGEVIMPFVRLGMEAGRQLFDLGQVVWKVQGALFDLWRPLIPFSTNLTNVVGGLQLFSATLTTVTGVLNDAAGQFAWAARRLTSINPGARPEMRDPREIFREAWLRLQGTGNNPLQGGQTVAAQQARHIGIEDVGMEARRSAFSQGQDVQAQIAGNTASMAANLTAMYQWLQRMFPGLPAAPTPAGGM